MDDIFDIFGLIEIFGGYWCVETDLHLHFDL